MASGVEEVVNEEISLEEMEEALWDKILDCPVCENQIALKNVRESSYRIVGRESDLRTVYEGVIEPLFYDVWVCQVCLYSSRREHFTGLALSDIENIKEARDELFRIARCGEFVGVRSKEAAKKSFLLADICYKRRRATYETLAGLYLRAAWLLRYLKDETGEKGFLTKALDNYLLSFEKEGIIKGKLGEDGLTYLIGELHNRLSDEREAIRYFGQVIRSRGSRPEFRRMAEDQTDSIRRRKEEFENSKDSLQGK